MKRFIRSHLRDARHRFLSRSAVALLLAVALLTCAGCIGNIPETSSGRSGSPAAAPEKISGEALRDQLDAAVQDALAHRLNLRDHAAWQIVHGAMAFKHAFPVLTEDGELVSAIDYALAGGKIRGWSFEPGIVLNASTGRRGLRSLMDPGSKVGQGHPDQWLGYLAECGFPPDQTIVVDGVTYTIADLISQTEWDVSRNVQKEYSWTLMALSAYRPTDYTWKDSEGQQWSLEKLVEIECEHELEESACGGSHRLFGLTMAVNRRVAAGKPLDGAWKKADAKIKNAIASAKRYQNPDGSFSTNYFERPGTSADLAQNLGATGHVLEFLTAALPQEELEQPWVKRAALKVCEILSKTRDVPLECGGLYHAAHGLILYRQRLFGPLELKLPEA